VGTVIQYTQGGKAERTQRWDRTQRAVQLAAGRLAAKVSTEQAAWTGATTTRFERTSP